MKKLTTAAMLASLVLSGAAFAQNDPKQSAQNSDAAKPNSPLKEKGQPDAGQFNPTGRAAVPVAPAPVVVPAPAPAPAVVVPPARPAPAPFVTPPPPPPPAPAPAPLPPRHDRG